ncbi:hypothetical protein OEB96_45395 [Paraliomyxa miuraensis]|nr:hypothetical protein [Paraliomyxa miuraensis]
MLTIVAALAILGCGPGAELDDPSSSSSSGGESTGSTAAPSSTSATSASTTDPGDGTASTDTGEPPSGYEDDGVDTGCAFTCPNPPPPPPPPGQWCNLNCPEGEKCMPWANDGGIEWNAVRCSPLAPDPGDVGDPCTVEGWPWSGIDDCDDGLLCFGVDLRTNEGVCHAFCGGIDEGLCPEGASCAQLPQFVPVCVTSCDPLVPDCDMGMQCLPSGSAFTCLPHDGLGLPLGEPCSAPEACAGGALCAFDPAITCGNAPGEGCCASPCDVNAPGPCGGPGSQCVPWFPFRAPPELAHLGACTP